MALAVEFPLQSVSDRPGCWFPGCQRLLTGKQRQYCTTHGATIRQRKHRLRRKMEAEAFRLGLRPGIRDSMLRREMTTEMVDAAQRYEEERDAKPAEYRMRLSIQHEGRSRWTGAGVFGVGGAVRAKLDDETRHSLLGRKRVTYLPRDKYDDPDNAKPDPVGQADQLTVFRPEDEDKNAEDRSGEQAQRRLDEERLIGSGRLAREIRAWNWWHRKRFYRRTGRKSEVAAQKRFRSRRLAARRAMQHHECGYDGTKATTDPDAGCGWWAFPPEPREDIGPRACCVSHLPGTGGRVRHRLQRLHDDEERFDRTLSDTAMTAWRLRRSGRQIAAHTVEDVCPKCQRFASDCQRLMRGHASSAVTACAIILMDRGVEAFALRPLSFLASNVHKKP